MHFEFGSCTLNFFVFCLADFLHSLTSIERLVCVLRDSIAGQTGNH